MPSETKGTNASGGGKVPVWRRVLDWKLIVLIVAFITIWWVLSRVIGGNAVPPPLEVWGRFVEIVTTVDGWTNLLLTLGRVGIGLAVAFVVGTGLGLWAGASAGASGFLLPIIRFIQGIPSLSWVVIAVIWFGNVEVRVFFVMLLVTLPGFALQAYDSYKAIPAELRDMARSFRPRDMATFREITLPGITPGLFTAWKVNLGLGIRMVLVAELVGASVGVGSQLLTAQQLFDMSAVIAWTLLLAVCMLILQAIIDGLEAYALRYRAVASTAETTRRPVSPSSVPSRRAPARADADRLVATKE